MTRNLNELPIYYRYLRPEIMSAIPDEAIRILDIGCATGMLGKALKEKNPQRYVVGIELNDEAFEYAKIHLDEVIYANIEELEPPFQEGEFDCIVCADVLEHLVDPWKIAKRYATFLKPEGILIASIPNIRHLPLLRDIAELGKWQYQDAGILDRTHLRFFTQKTFLELLQQANIICESITYLGGEELHRLYLQQENKIIRFGNFVLLNVSDEDFYELCAYQFLFTGIYQPNQTLSNNIKPKIIINTQDVIINASVIVPWWDHTELLEVWAKNIIHLKDYQVIFIDNGSATNGKIALEKFTKKHKIKLIRNEKNLGYAVANNQGAEIATGDYLLFFNNDIEIFENPVQYLCQLAGEGISGPGPLRAQTGEVLVEGWALCIKKHTFENLGKWCEDYHLGYADDVDLCHRAKAAGYSLTYAEGLMSDNWINNNHKPKNLLMSHIGAKTSRDGRIDQIALSNKNHTIFTKKFYPYLREINLIILPDWEQDIEKLSIELTEVLRSVLTHPNRDKLSLLIDTCNIDKEDANLSISGLLMELLMEENLEIGEENGTSIYVLEKPWKIEWDPILYRLHGKIALDLENQMAITQTRIDRIPSYELEELKNKRVVKLKDNTWQII